MNSKMNQWMGLAMLTAGIGAFTANADRATKTADAIWAEDQLFGTVVTDTSFKSPPAQSTDALFNFAGSGLSGQRGVSEAAPGNPGFNGGRWHVYAATFTDLGRSIHDPDGDGSVNFELTNAESVLEHAAMGHIVIEDTGIFFVCTLLPSND